MEEVGRKVLILRFDLDRDHIMEGWFTCKEAKRRIFQGKSN